MYTLPASSPVEPRRGIDAADGFERRVRIPARYRFDFGRTQTATPRLVHHARTEADVQQAWEISRVRGVPLTARGAGHSCHGQALSDGGLLLANEDADEAPIVPLGEGRFEVAARAHWRRVERALSRAGWSVPVLPDYLDLSVGGTLSVGGFGIDSARFGAQLDHVDRLRLIRADGRAAWCSAGERPELFSAALAGLGRAGVIERVVLRAVPRQRATTLFVSRHRSLAALVDAIGWMTAAPAGMPPMFKGVSARGTVSACYGFGSPTWREARNLAPWQPPGAGTPSRRYDVVRYRPLRSLSVKLWVARFGRAHRLWSDYVLDHDGLVAFERHLQSLAAKDAFGGCLHSVYLLAIRRLPRAVPLRYDAASAIRGPVGFGIGLYSMVPAGRADLVARVRAAAASCLERCLALGGRPYRYGCHDVDASLERAIYGPPVTVEAAS